MDIAGNEANELRRPRHFHIIIALDPNGRLMMKRDMVLIRRILIEVESWKNQGPKVVDFNDEQNKIGHHVALLHQAGFLEIYGGLHRSSATGQLDRILVKDMTWEGQEFIATLKNEDVWHKLKEIFSIEQLAQMPLAVIKAGGIAALTKIVESQIH